MYPWERYLAGRNVTILEFHFHIFQAVIIILAFVIYLLIQFTPRHTTATSVISLCVPHTAANSVFKLVHLHAYTLTVTLAGKFPATPTLVALNALLSSRRHFVANRLAWSIAPAVAIALLPTSAKQGVHEDNILENTLEA